MLMIILVLAATMIVCGAAGSGEQASPQMKTPSPSPEPGRARVLVFSKTAGFRHDSIPDGIRAIIELGAVGGFEVEATEDSNAFAPENLSRFRAVVWLSTTGEVLNDEQQRAFEQFIRAGGGYAGIHAASDTEYEWPWYGRLVGAYFKTHPPVQPAVNVVEIPDHPSTRMLPPRWERTDEWYSFRTNPRGREGIRVLMTLDETTYEPGGASMGDDHPIAWFHEFDGGRAWYTGGGHTSESFSEPLFREHLLGGIRWAAGMDASIEKGDATTDSPSSRSPGPPPAATPR